MAESSCMSFETDYEEAMTNLDVSPQELPKHPEYSSLQQRLDSFVGWIHENVVSSRVLALAGFFFTIAAINPVGRAYADIVPEELDHTTCYLCGSSLQDWKKDDDPRTRHWNMFFRSCLKEDAVTDTTGIRIEDSVVEDKNILTDNVENSKSQECDVAAEANDPVLDLPRDAPFPVQPINITGSME